MLRSNNNLNVYHVLAHTLIGMSLFYLHIYHISSIFNNSYDFKYLTKMEREMLFDSENALYYSYYKRIVEEKYFLQGFNKLLDDNITEYPTTINVVQRFNIYPEIIAGFLYDQYRLIANYLGLKTVDCWAHVTGDNRDDNYLKSYRCSGLGEPIYFYLEFVWYFGGLTVFILYMYGTYLSRHMLGGLTAVVYYFITHDNATQIHKKPSARENFALPFLIWQMFYLTICIERHNYEIKKKKNVLRNQINNNRYLQINFMMNIKEQHIKIYKRDKPLENLLTWIETNTEKDAVFAGPMNIMATVMLTTRRPIVNHPIVEYSDMRDKTKMVYTIFSRHLSSDIYNLLATLRVQYVILPLQHCYNTRDPCNLANLWDTYNSDIIRNPLFCQELITKGNPTFLKVLSTDKYIVLKIFSQSIKLQLKNVGKLVEYNM